MNDEYQPGRTSITKLDIMDRATNLGDRHDWFTYQDLITRNLVLIALHFFTLLTEPIVYLRYTIMESSGRNPIWYTFLLTIFFPIKPLFVLLLSTIQITFNVMKDLDHFEYMVCSLTEKAPLIKACLQASHAM